MKAKFILFAACALSLVACEGGKTNVTTDKEQALQQAVTPYVNNTVIATYSAMADAGMTLLGQCEQILAAQEAGQDYTTLMTHKEIPYSVEVVVESFKEEEKLIRIEAVIYVERESQKGIIIGHQGVALKRVSTEARRELERFFDKKIYLLCYVKVDKDWRSSDRAMRQYGYELE